jgi:hypothetical protein
MPIRIGKGAALWLVVALGCLGVPASFALAAQASGARAPLSQKDCAAASKTLYRQAEALSRRSKQIIPREFDRVAANLDDYCDGGDFAKARISIDWMSTCLKNFTRNYDLGFCSRNKSYFCALDPQSEACQQSH